MGRENGIAESLKLIVRIAAFIAVISLAADSIKDMVNDSKYNYEKRQYEAGETIEGRNYTVIVKGMKPFIGDSSSFEVAEGERLMDVEIQITNNQAEAEEIDRQGDFFWFYTLDGASCTYYGKTYEEGNADEIEELTDEIYLPAGRTKTLHEIIGVPQIAERIRVEYSEHSAKGSIENIISVE